MRFKRAGDGYTLQCPACHQRHNVDARWVFNGNFESPTLNKSVNIRAIDEGNVIYCCHFTLTNGQITYHNDCTHALVGKTVELPELQ
jgi:hypothetical protein